MTMTFGFGVGLVGVMVSLDGVSVLSVTSWLHCTEVHKFSPCHKNEEELNLVIGT